MAPERTTGSTSTFSNAAKGKAAAARGKQTKLPGKKTASMEMETETHQSAQAGGRKCDPRQEERRAAAIAAARSTADTTIDTFTRMSPVSSPRALAMASGGHAATTTSQSTCAQTSASGVASGATTDAQCTLSASTIEASCGKRDAMSTFQLATKMREKSAESVAATAASALRAGSAHGATSARSVAATAEKACAGSARPWETRWQRRLPRFFFFFNFSHTFSPLQAPTPSNTSTSTAGTKPGSRPRPTQRVHHQPPSDATRARARGHWHTAPLRTLGAHVILSQSTRRRVVVPTRDNDSSTSIPIPARAA